MSGFKTKTTAGGGGDFPVAPEGTHPAVLVAMIDLGTHQDNYGDTVKWQRKVFLCWELVAEPLAGAGTSNHVIGLMFTMSLNKKAKLRGFIEKWLSKALPEDQEYDPAVLVGKPCLLTVVQTQSGEKSYAKVESVSAPVKGMAIPKPKHLPLLLDDCDAIDTNDLPEWLPYIYGQKVAEVVRDGKVGNRRGEGGNSERQPGEEAEEDADANVEAPF